jgi:dihydropteroate synthase
MGIINATPDSFSDGGRFFSPSAAVAHAIGMIEAGADIVDVGGESTRPGAVPVPEAEELQRVLPVIEQLARNQPQTTISIDTVKSGVARAALQAGAHIVNDVSALRLDPVVGTVCAEHGAGLVLMHSRGAVADMATFAHAKYHDVVVEVITELGERVAAARTCGVEDRQIVLDPGIGFSKKGEQSLAVLSGLRRLAGVGFPVLVGVSRKRFIGEITGVREPARRLGGTLGASVAALALGAHIFRVHDVREHREALDVAWAVLRSGV